MFKRILKKFKPKAKVKPKVKKTVKPKAGAKPKVKKTVKPKAGGKPKMTASEREMLKAIPKRVKDKINKKIKADQQSTGGIFFNSSKKPVTIKESIEKSGILKTSGSNKKAAQDYMDRIRRMKKGGRAR